MELFLTALVVLSVLTISWGVWSKWRAERLDFEPPESRYPSPEEIRRGLRALERSANDGG